MNIALEQTEEYVNGAVTNRYGDSFIRGNNGESLRTRNPRSSEDLQTYYSQFCTYPPQNRYSASTAIERIMSHVSYHLAVSTKLRQQKPWAQQQRRRAPSRPRPASPPSSIPQLGALRARRSRAQRPCSALVSRPASRATSPLNHLSV